MKFGQLKLCCALCCDLVVVEKKMYKTCTSYHCGKCKDLMQYIDVHTCDKIKGCGQLSQNITTIRDIRYCENCVKKMPSAMDIYQLFYTKKIN